LPGTTPRFFSRERNKMSKSILSVLATLLLAGPVSAATSSYTKIFSEFKHADTPKTVDAIVGIYGGECYNNPEMVAEDQKGLTGTWLIARKTKTGIRDMLIQVEGVTRVDRYRDPAYLQKVKKDLFDYFDKNEQHDNDTTFDIDALYTKINKPEGWSKLGYTGAFLFRTKDTAITSLSIVQRKDDADRGHFLTACHNFQKLADAQVEGPPAVLQAEHSPIYKFRTFQGH
jgi:hypothetical protein